MKRLSMMEKLRRLALFPFQKASERSKTREFRRWQQGWKRNALFNGQPLTRSMIRRVGSRKRAQELGLI